MHHEHAANHTPATENGFSNPSLRSPRTSTSALLVIVTGESAGPPPEEITIFEAAKREVLGSAVDEGNGGN